MSTIAVTVKETHDLFVGWIAKAQGMTYYAPASGGLYTDDWRELLPPAHYQAGDVSSVRWLVRRAIRR